MVVYVCVVITWKIHKLDLLKVSWMCIDYMQVVPKCIFSAFMVFNSMLIMSSGPPWVIVYLITFLCFSILTHAQKMLTKPIFHELKGLLLKYEGGGLIMWTSGPWSMIEMDSIIKGFRYSHETVIWIYIYIFDTFSNLSCI